MGEALGDDEYMTDIHRGSTGFGFNIKGVRWQHGRGSVRGGCVFQLI